MQESALMQTSQLIELVATHLPRTLMQEPNILVSLNAHKTTSITLPDLDKLRLERQNIPLTPSGEGVRTALPQNLPVTTSSPAVLVDVEAEVVVAQ
jgi:hypothetical protein